MGYDSKKDWIEMAQVAKPAFYERFVDNNFAVFGSKSDAETFYTYLNTEHKSIKFKYEKQIKNKLPFLDFLISNNENVIEKYLQDAINNEIANIETRYFKLPLIGMYSKVTQNKIEKLCKIFCKNAKAKLVFTSDKLCQTFTYKDFYPSVFSSKVVYKFACVSCNASYVGQTH